MRELGDGRDRKSKKDGERGRERRGEAALVSLGMVEVKMHHCMRSG